MLPVPLKLSFPSCIFLHPTHFLYPGITIVLSAVLSFPGFFRTIIFPLDIEITMEIF